MARSNPMALVLAQVAEATEGLPDAFVAGVGTGGTINGVGRRLRKANITSTIPEIFPGIEGLTPCLGWPSLGCQRSRTYPWDRSREPRTIEPFRAYGIRPRSVPCVSLRPCPPVISPNSSISAFLIVWISSSSCGTASRKMPIRSRFPMPTWKRSDVASRPTAAIPPLVHPGKKSKPGSVPESDASTSNSA